MTRWERWVPLTGVLAVVLWIVGVLVLETDSPGSDAPAQEILAYFQDDRGKIFAGVFLFSLGTAFFLWFLGSLRVALLAAEGTPGLLTGIAFAGGVGKAVFDLGVMGGIASGAIAADEREDLSAEVAQALSFVDEAAFLGAEFMAFVFMGAVAVAVITRRALPVWLGWLAAVIAIGLIVIPIGWAFLLFGVPLWVLLASVLMWQRGTTAPATPFAT